MRNATKKSRWGEVEDRGGLRYLEKEITRDIITKGKWERKSRDFFS